MLTKVTCQTSQNVIHKPSLNQSRNTDGILIYDKDMTLQMWSECLLEFLSKFDTTNQFLLDDLLTHSINLSLIQKIYYFTKVILDLKYNKATDADNIPAELSKYGNCEQHCCLSCHSRLLVCQVSSPTMEGCNIILVCKPKSDRATCDKI